MDNKICGKCAISSDMPLSERLELAESRIMWITYKCPLCGLEHVWKHPSKFGNVSIEMPMNEQITLF